jgi:hypothetical protein
MALLTNRDRSLKSAWTEARSTSTTSAIEPFRFFMTESDRRAMRWIRRHTPPEAVFAINTTFWVPGIAHGTDRGYWIPYFTGRQTTVGCMLPGQFARSARLSDLVLAVQRGEDRLAALADHNVIHIYIGRNGHYPGQGLNAEVLRTSPFLSVVYEQEGVTILALRPRLHPFRPGPVK